MSTIRYNYHATLHTMWYNVSIQAPYNLVFVRATLYIFFPFLYCNNRGESLQRKLIHSGVLKLQGHSMLTRLATMNDLTVDRTTKVGASIWGDRKTANTQGQALAFMATHCLTNKFMVLEWCILTDSKVSAPTDQRTLRSTTWRPQDFYSSTLSKTYSVVQKCSFFCVYMRLLTAVTGRSALTNRVELSYRENDLTLVPTDIFSFNVIILSCKFFLLKIYGIWQNDISQNTSTNLKTKTNLT